MPLLPDTPFAHGKYHIVNHLGAGASGDVYLANHLHFGRLEAVKMLSRAEEDDGSSFYRQVRERFALEAQVGARVRHPNVIEVYDHDEADGVLYLTMQYAPGGSVADAIGALGPLPIDQAVRWLRDAASGLAALHDADVIHRDVKPSNLLVMADGCLAVADLGLAQVAGGQLSQRASVGSAASLHPGTPDYMSPEHVSPRTLLPTSDVYSLGCVAFEMLTAKRYVQVQTRVEAPSNLRSDIPQWLDELVQRMLLVEPGVKPSDARNERKRFVRMEQVLEVLEAMPAMVPDAPVTAEVEDVAAPVVSDWAFVDASTLAAVVEAESTDPNAVASTVEAEQLRTLPEEATSPSVEAVVAVSEETSPAMSFPVDDAPSEGDEATQSEAEQEAVFVPGEQEGAVVAEAAIVEGESLETEVGGEATTSADSGEPLIADWARVDTVRYLSADELVVEPVADGAGDTPKRAAASSTTAETSMFVPMLVIIIGVVFAMLIIIMTSR